MGSATLVRNIGQLRRRLDLGGGDPRHIVTPADLIRESIETGLPRRFQPTAVRQYHYRNVPHLLRGLKTLVAAHIFRIPTINGSLRLKVIRADGVEIDLGLVSLRVVTTTGVGRIVKAFDNTVTDITMKYHALGTGGTAEATGDTALVAEITTAYTPANTRATATLSEPSGNVSQSLATNTIQTTTVANTEHGVMDQAATGGGNLLDRTLYTVVNLAIGDSLQSTYQLTFAAGG